MRARSRPCARRSTAHLTAGTRHEGTAEASHALRQAWDYIAEANGPPDSEDEQHRLTSTLHALDDATRLAEVASEGVLVPGSGVSEGETAASLCAETMRHAVSIADKTVADGAPREHDLVELERCASELGALQSKHREATLAKVASGALTSQQAMASVDAVRRMEAIARHAWHCALQLK